MRVPRAQTDRSAEEGDRSCCQLPTAGPRFQEQRRAGQPSSEQKAGGSWHGVVRKPTPALRSFSPAEVLAALDVLPVRRDLLVAELALPKKTRHHHPR